MFQSVLQYLSWMPTEFMLIASSVIALFGFYVTCKLCKLLWDVLPFV